MVTYNLLVSAAILGITQLKFLYKFHSENSCMGLQYLVDNCNMLSSIGEVRKILDSLS